MNSVRRQTALLVAATIAAALVVGDVSLWLVIRRSLVSQFDDGVTTRATAAESLTTFDRDRIEMDVTSEIFARYKPGKDAEFFRLWVESGAGWRGLYASESLGKSEWNIDPASAVIGAPIGLALPDGRPGRGMWLEFRPAVDVDDLTPEQAMAHPGGKGINVPRVRLVVAQSRAGLDGTLGAIGWSIAGVGVALAMLTALGGWWAVGRGLRPLDVVGRRVASIGADSLSERIDLRGLPQELRPVVERLNEALGRLEEAFARERRFTAGAAHELRTPLSEIRMMLEVALARPRTVERWERTATEVLEVAGSAEALLARLLAIARGTGGADAGHADLVQLVQKEMARLGPEAERANADFEPELPETAWAKGSAEAAGAVVRNVLENAVRHGDRGARIHVRVAAEGGSLKLVVVNGAAALGREDVGRLFEPFWRKDAARSPGSGYGLGLTLSRSLVESCGGTMAAELGAGELRVVATWIPAQAVSGTLKKDSEEAEQSESI